MLMKNDNRNEKFTLGKYIHSLSSESIKMIYFNKQRESGGGWINGRSNACKV
jgi:hypothetical protein